MSNVYRIAIANIDALALAQWAQDNRLDCTVYGGAYGAGEWGVEPTSILETCAQAVPPVRLQAKVRALLNSLNESCAFVTVNGAGPVLWNARGPVWVTDVR